MKNILKLNIILIVIYLTTLSLAKWLSFPHLVYVLGLLIFFLPGLNLALALEQATGRLGRARLFVWTFLFSMLVTPAFIFYFPLSTQKIAQEKEILLGFFLWTFIALVVFLLSYLWKKGEITLPKLPSFRKHTAFWLAVLIYIALLVAHFLIYPFIPEGDGYSYIQAIEKTIDSGKFFRLDNRASFYGLVWATHHLTQLPIYWMFKLVFPFLGLGMIVVSYKASLELGMAKKLAVLTSLSFFLFPVVLQATLTFRPQMIFLIIFPMAMWLLLDALREKDWRKIALLFLLAIIGIRIHQAFIFLIISVFIVILYLIFQRYRSKGVYFFLIAILALMLIFRKHTMEFYSYVEIFFKSLIKLDFNWWFLDGYTTHYGEKVSWPSFSWLYYYGNNVGLVFPFLLTLGIWKKMALVSWAKKYWPLFSIIAILIVFAEVLPRLGIFYEPNRFLLFCATIAALLVPPLVKSLEEKISPRFLLISIATLALATFGASMALTHSKQGMVDWNEYQATQFIQENIPENAIVLTARSSGILFNYFYHRSTVFPSKQFFLEDNKEKDRFILENLDSIPQYQKLLQVQNKKVRGDEAYNKIYTSEVPQIPEEARVEKTHRPIYIFYSKNKEKGIRKTRSWWQEQNFFGADLSKFDDTEMYEKVYDEGGVLVWKIKL